MQSGARADAAALARRAKEASPRARAVMRSNLACARGLSLLRPARPMAGPASAAEIASTLISSPENLRDSVSPFLKACSVSSVTSVPVPPVCSSPFTPHGALRPDRSPQLCAPASSSPRRQRSLRAGRATEYHGSQGSTPNSRPDSRRLPKNRQHETAGCADSLRDVDRVQLRRRRLAAVSRRARDGRRCRASIRHPASDQPVDPDNHQQHRDVGEERNQQRVEALGGDDPVTMSSSVRTLNTGCSGSMLSDRFATGGGQARGIAIGSNDERQTRRRVLRLRHVEVRLRRIFETGLA